MDSTWTDTGKGLKADDGKIRFDLIDAEVNEELAKVLTFGAEKYAEENWRKGINFKRLIAAAKRHLNEIEKNNDLDVSTLAKENAHRAKRRWDIQEAIKKARELEDK